MQWFWDDQQREYRILEKNKTRANRRKQPRKPKSQKQWKKWAQKQKKLGKLHVCVGLFLVAFILVILHVGWFFGEFAFWLCFYSICFFQCVAETNFLCWSWCRNTKGKWITLDFVCIQPYLIILYPEMYPKGGWVKGFDWILCVPNLIQPCVKSNHIEPRKVF